MRKKYMEIAKNPTTFKKPWSLRESEEGRN